MAMIGDMFGGGDASRGGSGSKVNEWGEFLSDPAGRAALISFGLAMMQPVQPGQSEFGQFGQALGAAGEAVGGIADRELKEKEAASRVDLREARATSAEDRARLAESRTDTSALRLGLMREREERLRQQGKTQNVIRLQSAYNAAKKAAQKEWQDVHGLTRDAPPFTFPSFTDWVKADPTRVKALEPPPDLDVEGDTGDILPSRAAPTSGAASVGHMVEGRVYRNPTTGERFRWTGGKRVPL